MKKTLLGKFLVSFAFGLLFSASAVIAGPGGGENRDQDCTMDWCCNATGTFCCDFDECRSCDDSPTWCITRGGW